VYSIQHYVIQFVSDLRQVGGFFQVIRFPPPIKLHDRHDITEILLTVALNTTTIDQTDITHEFVVITLVLFYLKFFDVLTKTVFYLVIKPVLHTGVLFYVSSI